MRRAQLFTQQLDPVEGGSLRMRLIIFLGAAVVLLPAHAHRTDVAFEETPLKKVESSFLSTVARDLSDDEAFEYQVRILERQGKYYWASRGMKQLYRSESGVYITYHAVDGTGYVRVGSPMLLDLREKLPEETKRQEIGYVEHLLTQFASVTYYGNRK
jgi:hypothetical protein